MSDSSHAETYPWAYTQGYVDFYGCHLLVDSRVLIPRLESECLVRKARDIIKTIPRDDLLSIIDVGCGSGALGLSLLSSLRDTHTLSTLHLRDISDGALEVAHSNTHLLGLESVTEQSIGNLLDDPPRGHLEATSTLVIFANLPYIRDDERPLLSSDTQHEPAIALFGTESDGLGLYRSLWQQIKSLQSAYPHIDIHVLFEYGHAQRTRLIESLAYTGPHEHFDDYRGVGRFTHYHLPPMSPKAFANIDQGQIWRHQHSRQALIFHTIDKTINTFAPEIHPKSVKVEGKMIIIRLKSPVEIMIVREQQSLLQEALTTLYARYGQSSLSPSVFIYR